MTIGVPKGSDAGTVLLYMYNPIWMACRLHVLTDFQGSDRKTLVVVLAIGRSDIAEYPLRGSACVGWLLFTSERPIFFRVASLDNQPRLAEPFGGGVAAEMTHDAWQGVDLGGRGSEHAFDGKLDMPQIHELPATAPSQAH